MRLFYIVFPLLNFFYLTIPSNTYFWKLRIIFEKKKGIREENENENVISIIDATVAFEK